MTGLKAPPFLYGTAWKEAQTESCIEKAIVAGFRGIDTANQRKHYFEAGVGAALKKIFEKGTVSRQDLFLQTKFTSIDGQDSRLPYSPDDPLAAQVQQSFDSSLEHLHTDYIDSYVLHGPSHPTEFLDEDLEVWSAMETLYSEGKVLALGVSNMNLGQLQTLVEQAKVKPIFLQNRCFASRAWDRELREYCAANEITYQGFSLLTANPSVLKSPKFLEIAKRVGRTPAQIIYRFATQIGMIALNGTSDPKHMAEDLESLNFELDLADLHAIEKISL